MLLNGLFMGTVMGVVQVSVQSAAGPGAAGRGRGVGAILALDRRRLRHRAGRHHAVRRAHAQKSGGRARLRGARSRAGHVAPALTVAQVAIQADIRHAFRAAFLAMAVFTTGGFFLALTNPLRRI